MATTRIIITTKAWRARPCLYLLGAASISEDHAGLSVALPPRSGYVLVRDAEAPRVALVDANGGVWRGEYEAAEPWDLPLVGIVRDDDQPGQPSRRMAACAAGLGHLVRSWSWDGRVVRRTLVATVDEAEAEARAWAARLEAASDQVVGEGVLVRDGIVLAAEVAIARTGLVEVRLAPERLPDEAPVGRQTTHGVRCAVAAPMTERDWVRSELVTAARRASNSVASAALMHLAGITEAEIDDAFYWRQSIAVPTISEREMVLQRRDRNDPRNHWDDRQDIR